MSLTVKELIKQLKKLPKDSKVYFQEPYDDCDLIEIDNIFEFGNEVILSS
jgi:hypothetical protein